MQLSVDHPGFTLTKKLLEYLIIFILPLTILSTAHLTNESPDLHSSRQPCYLHSKSVVDLRGRDRMAGFVWVYFHAILVGETWPCFQSLLPDGGNNLQGRGGGCGVGVGWQA